MMGRMMVKLKSCIFLLPNNLSILMWTKPKPYPKLKPNNGTEITSEAIIKGESDNTEEDIGGHPTRLRKNPIMNDPIHVVRTYHKAFNTAKLSHKDIIMKLYDKTKTKTTSQQPRPDISTPFDNKNTLIHVITYTRT